MLRAILNRATMRVAETTDLSGRVTAESIKHALYAKKQVGEVSQVLLCVAAVGLLSSCASSSNSPLQPGGSHSPEEREKFHETWGFG